MVNKDGSVEKDPQEEIVCQEAKDQYEDIMKELGVGTETEDVAGDAGGNRVSAASSSDERA